MAEADCPCDFKGQRGKRVTILSVDGGGVRGVIPSTILECLETHLQDLDGPDARIADYFDVVSGTSTGALIAAMLTFPNAHGRPLYCTKDITSLYLNFSEQIFPQNKPGFSGATEEVLTMLNGPKYTSNNLEMVLMDQLHDLKMSETVTELLIPSFDIKLMQPAFFSTSEAKDDELKNAYVRDVCRGTSAAPTYFPPHYFQTIDSFGNSRDFNLVDGAMVANNPTYLSIIHVLKEVFKGKDQYFDRMKDRDYRSLLVLSLGTGTSPESYNAKDVAGWGALSWVLKGGRVPIMDICLNGNADMVDFNLSVVFQTIECRDNYLRIQTNDLPKGTSSVDNSTSKNMQRLCEIGSNLLNQSVTMVDVATGTYIPQPSRGTNKEALARLAQELVEERKARQSHCSNL